MAKRYFITGIGTGIGKTIVSAILTEKLNADYWKPIQSGDLEQSDSIAVAGLMSNAQSKIHQERHRLSQPLSPHLSARIDHIQIELADFTLPTTDSDLIIEGAGGLMVPLNDHDLLIDMIQKLDVEVIIVSKNYLGSINHTLLTVNTLKQYQIPIRGIIFSGEANSESESYILNYTRVKCLGKIPFLAELTKESIRAAGAHLNFS
jgi:dethiobiotin synthetase